jgi:hypothetical protein
MINTRRSSLQKQSSSRIQQIDYGVSQTTRVKEKEEEKDGDFMTADDPAEIQMRHDLDEE